MIFCFFAGGAISPGESKKVSCGWSGVYGHWSWRGKLLFFSLNYIYYFKHFLICLMFLLCSLSLGSDLEATTRSGRPGLLSGQSLHGQQALPAAWRLLPQTEEGLRGGPCACSQNQTLWWWWGIFFYCVMHFLQVGINYLFLVVWLLHQITTQEYTAV